VRRELFALRSLERDSLTEFVELAKPLSVEVIGDLALLSAERKRIVEELIRNAATHSKGRTIRVELNRNSIRVSDDGQGLFGISELVPEGKFRVEVTQNGTAVEVEFA
jgi:signal transduction histidine kinase